MNKIEETFENLHPGSKQLAKDARNVFPMGVTHVSRSMAPYPIYMVEGKGPKKWDVDGNEYIDYRTGHGSMILGQAHPAIVKAVKDQVEKGTHFSSGTNLEIKWAECVKTLVPSVEKMRFVSSGTEALMMAFKMARVFTGREKIVKFSGAFHGWSDTAYVTNDETDKNYGITKGTSESVINVAPYDLKNLETVISKNDDVAAIIFQGNDIAPPEFVHGLKELSEKYSTLLVFDEVVSGFRWSESGSQGHYGITPDLSTFAKILAGGLPGGCVGGRAEIIDTVGEQGIRHPGTFNANPLSAASGSTALSIVAKEPIITTAHKQAERLRDGINRTLTELEIPGGAYGMSSIVMISLGEPVDTSNPYAQPDTIEQGGRPVANAVLDHLHTAIINEGLWTNPASMILSSTHTDDDIDETVTRYSKGLQAVRKLGML